MIAATLFLLCWVEQPNTSGLLSIYCGEQGCELPKPGPVCEVVKLEDAAIRHYQKPDEQVQLYEITPGADGPTLRKRALPTLRIEESQ